MVTMLSVLAIDAGGTSTRAVIVDEAGNCLGFGHSGGGNPISAGFEPALASLAAATRMALESSHGTEVDFLRSDRHGRSHLPDADVRS